MKTRRFDLTAWLCAVLSFGVLLVTAQDVHAWGHHTLITRQALSAMPEIAGASPVKAESLETFLMANEKELEGLLIEIEKWARQEMPDYDPCPDNLAFRSTGIEVDVRKRFFHATRINPNSRLALYLQLMPAEGKGKKLLPPEDITTLPSAEFEEFAYVAIKEGELVPPLEVIAAASDEPDYGMDLGLYENNSTDYGKMYGFGKQPFGNPNLDYGSQAPFHMGFYHEENIVNSLAGFIRKTYPVYRTYVYKRLAEFAFQHGHDYWGWRFAGWGMHYLQDLSYPYHSTLLPGVSVGRMLWINTLGIFGATQEKDNAVQLVSNRHLALESFQKELMYQLCNAGRTDHILFTALKEKPRDAAYTDQYLIDVVSRQSNAVAGKIDQAILTWMPPRLVNDPAFELDGSAESGKMYQEVEKARGAEGIEKLTLCLTDLFREMGGYMRTYVYSILEKKN